MKSVSNTMTFREHLERILTERDKIRDGVFGMSYAIVEAIDQLGEQTQDELALELNMTKGTMSKWIAIGRHKTLQNNSDKCPNTFGALYQLTTLDKQLQLNYGEEKGKKKFEEIFTKKKISPQTTRADVDSIIKLQKDLFTKNKKQSFQQYLHDIEDREEEKKPKNVYTLKELLKVKKFFNTFLVYPSDKQLLKWNKLHFPSYIHEDYPLTECRNTSHTGTIRMFIVLSNPMIEVGMKLLNAWGFNYKFTYTPRDDYKDKFMLYGERGSDNHIRTFELKDFDHVEYTISVLNSFYEPNFLLVGNDYLVKKPNANWTTVIG